MKVNRLSTEQKNERSTSSMPVSTYFKAFGKRVARDLADSRFKTSVFDDQGYALLRVRMRYQLPLLPGSHAYVRLETRSRSDLT